MSYRTCTLSIKQQKDGLNTRVSIKKCNNDCQFLKPDRTFYDFANGLQNKFYPDNKNLHEHGTTKD